MLEEAVLRSDIRFTQDMIHGEKGEKVGLSFIDFNMFPINIFKISHTKYVFTV